MKVNYYKSITDLFYTLEEMLFISVLCNHILSIYFFIIDTGIDGIFCCDCAYVESSLFFVAVVVVPNFVWQLSGDLAILFPRAQV